jgi:nitrite reductase (NO-forming)
MTRNRRRAEPRRVAEGRRAGRPARNWRGRRHLAPAAVVLAYLLAGGVTAALGGRIAGAGWLALHLVLLGGASNAIIVWSEHFAAALLHVPASSDRVALARLLAFNLAVLSVLAGVHAGQPILVSVGGSLLAMLVLAHAVGLARGIRRSLTSGLGDTVWFYVAASAALVAGIGLGVLLGGGGAAGSGDAYVAMRLAHAHLNVLGWIGLAVIGTQFTLWPTVLHTRMVPGLRGARTAALLLMVAGLALATAGLLGQNRGVAAAGLAGYTAGLTAALRPFVRTMLQRRPHGAAAWMLLAGIAWFTLAVMADLVILLASSRVAKLDGRLGRLIPAIAVGFGLQTLAGALTYLLPAIWGRGAHGNRRLTRLLEAGWPLRVAALNLGVTAVTVGKAGSLVTQAGQLLVALGLGSFVVLAAIALAWRPTGEQQPRRDSG